MTSDRTLKSFQIFSLSKIKVGDKVQVEEELGKVWPYALRGRVTSISGSTILMDIEGIFDLKTGNQVLQTTLRQIGSSISLQAHHIKMHSQG